MAPPQYKTVLVSATARQVRVAGCTVHTMADAQENESESETESVMKFDEEMEKEGAVAVAMAEAEAEGDRHGKRARSADPHDGWARQAGQAGTVHACSYGYGFGFGG